MKKILIITGPTASGKSARALEIAAAQNGVVINCDSMQIYDALPILTAQPTAQDKQTAPHRLYSLLHPNASSSAGEWVRLAMPVIEETLENGQTPIICGGTGLYIKALEEGLSPVPETPPEIRARANAYIAQIGCPALHKELEARDPAIKGRFHENHAARILRAWEVLESTGKSITHWQSLPPVPPPADWHFETQIIMPPREEIYANCNQRFKWMLDNGALEEVATFAARIENGEINENALIVKAHGFRELRDYLNGKSSREDAIEKSQIATRQYVKRQTTWLRNQLERINLT